MNNVAPRGEEVHVSGGGGGDRRSHAHLKHERCHELSPTQAEDATDETDQDGGTTIEQDLEEIGGTVLVK